MHRIAPGPKAIGVILPSSNRVVERVTQAALSALPGVDACFARVPYGGHPQDGYDTAPFVAAATMLAEAGADAGCWNATRGAGLGFDLEHEAPVAGRTAARDLCNLRAANRVRAGRQQR